MKVETSDWKILQIIPAPKGLVAVYADTENGQIHEPVACLALVEYGKDKGMIRKVHAILAIEYLDFAETDENFLHLEFK